MSTKNSVIDKETIRDLAVILNETDLTDIEIEHGDLRIRVSRNVTVQAAPAVYAPAPAAAPAAPAAAAPAAEPSTRTRKLLCCIFRVPACHQNRIGSSPSAGA